MQPLRSRTVFSAQTGRSSERQLRVRERCTRRNTTSSILCFISKCADDVTTTRTVTWYPNQKPWLNAEGRALLKARDAAFRAGEASALGEERTDCRHREGQSHINPENSESLHHQRSPAHVEGHQLHHGLKHQGCTMPKEPLLARCTQQVLSPR